VRLVQGEFIPVAEDTGLVASTGDWVFKQALKQVKQWQKIDPNFQVSVNKPPCKYIKLTKK
jgi:EAL domain-containing protein (putative c-di-GMP-specific phosphodiesterase class I)